MKRFIGALAALATAGTVLASAPAASGAAPDSAVAPKERSLVTWLRSDGNAYDRNGADFDIVTRAALAVLAAKPDSPVAVLADGDQRLTAFLPNDRAFRLLAKDLTGRTIHSERKVLNTLVSAAGVDTIEQVLLYHVVLGKKLTSKKVLKADGARFTTAQGARIRVKVRHAHGRPVISIVDQDRNARNARVVLSKVDRNKGNKQIGHGIDRVLRPIDL